MLNVIKTIYISIMIYVYIIYTMIASIVIYIYIIPTTATTTTYYYYDYYYHLLPPTSYYLYIMIYMIMLLYASMIIFIYTYIAPRRSHFRWLRPARSGAMALRRWCGVATFHTTSRKTSCSTSLRRTTCAQARPSCGTASLARIYYIYIYI